MKKNKLLRRLTAALLAAVLALSIALPVFASDDGDTIYINSVSDLLSLAKSCAYDQWSVGKTVVLQQDLSLEGMFWAPIPSFSGQFKGNGHTISDLTVSGEYSPAGLFGIVEEQGSIESLSVRGIVSVSDSADTTTGGIVGINHGTLISCQFTGVVTGDCEVGGIVRIEEKDKLLHVIVDTPTGEAKDYLIPFGFGVLVKTGDEVVPGTILTNGAVYPQDILKTQGVKGVQDYILKEIQSVYRSQGVDINDKHVEIIVRQMLKKVQVENPGDTDILPGEKLDIFRFEDENLQALEAGKCPATGKRTLLGITKAALATESFLSAASFQETARVLTEAAIKNKIDPLIGLKENVIIGKLIPAGTGVKEYKNLSPQVTAISAEK